MGARFIQEVYYPDWLANVVMVKKANGKWRMCVDFTDLNKACPKDSYPLPRIDQLVDSTAGHKLLSFMDAFSGYNQIRMDEADQEKTSFVTSQGLFCYKIGRNVEVYVDDMLVKSQDEGRHLDDLQETFNTLRQYHMKLNPSKCAFGVSSGKFLGFMVSHRGIEANPDKIQAILDMKPLQNTKEIQSLTRRVAALNRKAFEWTDECQRAFEDLKAYLTKSPLLSPSVVGEKLYLYLVVTPYAWAVELSEFDIRYQPRHAIKAQALADFIAEFTPSHDETEDNDRWVVHVDGSSTKYAGGIGVVLQSPEGDKLRHKVRLQYQATNNEVEYEALFKGLELAKSVEAKSIFVLGDSQLVMGQVNGMYEAKEERMRKYLSRVMCLMKRFEKAKFVQIPREENVEADTIAKEASASEFIDKSDQIQYMPSIDIPEVQQLPEEKDEARKLRVRSARYLLLNEVLYKRGFSQPYLRCLASDEANYVLREVHEGACGNHSGAKSLVSKIVRAGYYWSNMQADAKAYVKVCDQCQRFSNVPRQPSEFGVPKVLVFDNGRQFDNALFRDFCAHFGIKNHYSSPAHPQANGQAEVANQSLLKIIKIRLEGAKGVWLEELPGVLWAYRTMVRTPTGETPFKLTYGSEAVIPAEVHMANHKVMMYKDKDNEEQLRLNPDLVDEVRADAEYRTAKYKNLMARQYDAMVKPRRFNIGDLVLRKVSLATKNLAHGKLGPN
ncbi:uncharacterized protein LOC115985174 [Quercus lobata]|uniref:uncharacterized protein LOC115985174 n=1 Tax=Quercus lobata TaxID=97700 RepID=UPI001243E2C1|nr:uncharacterized protein LOC115985174 [Quercus lobata]